MKVKIFSKSLILLVAVSAIGCGGSGYHSQSQGSSSISLVVLSTTERDSQVAVGKIARFEVVLEGEGLELKKLSVSSNAHEVEINSVRAGSNRRITVTAFNRDDRPIRKGESKPFDISEGETKDVVVDLQAIPTFINVRDGNVVTGKRLVFEVLADPGESLAVKDTTSKNNVFSLISLSTNGEAVTSNSHGLGYFNPKQIEFGERIFRVESLLTGRSSEVRLVVTEGVLRKPAPLFSSGTIIAKGTHIQPTRIGQWSARKLESNSIHLGELWPSVLLQQLYLKESL
ncbi:MAG: hypothetical protein Q7T03_03535 [Deltaproteobacteria bacterium]|nr:hypothetical protein [Deltaproteobacteria bacterium]